MKHVSIFVVCQIEFKPDLAVLTCSPYFCIFVYLPSWIIRLQKDNDMERAGEEKGGEGLKSSIICINK